MRLAVSLLCAVGLIPILALDSADAPDPVRLYRRGNALYAAGELIDAAQAFRGR